MSDIQWGGEWEHEACGATGEALWGDGEWAYSGHDCGEDEVDEGAVA